MDVERLFVGALFGLAMSICVQAGAQTEPVQGEPQPPTTGTRVTMEEIIRHHEERKTSGAETTEMQTIHRPLTAPLQQVPVSRGAAGSTTSASPASPTPEVLNSSPTPQAPVPTTSFLAKDDNHLFIPPDTMGAAGPNHLVVTLNGTFRIQTKTGTVLSDVSLNSFFSAGGITFTSTSFDPKIAYDANSGRFIMSAGADAESTSSAIVLAVSETSDPTGAWHIIKIDADSANTTWADYPCLGMNGTWIAITANMFNMSNQYVGPKMWVFDKSQALAGTFVETTFATGFDNTGIGSGFTLQPCLTFGSEPTLWIIDNSFASGSNNLARISRITGTATTPAWSLDPVRPLGGGPTNNGLSNIQDFGAPINPAQSGTTYTLDGGDARVLNAVFRTSGTGVSSNAVGLWFAYTAGMPNLAPVHDNANWEHLNVTNGTVLNEGTITDVTLSYMYPTVAVTANGDMGIGFTGTSALTFPSAYYTNRPGTGTGAGVVQPVYESKAGASSYVKLGSGTSNRWGDYSMTMIDPSDGLVWTVQEFAYGTNTWGTWWAKFDPSVPVTVSAFAIE